MPLTCNNSMRVALASQGLWVACVTADTSSFEQSEPRTFCSWPYAGWLMSSNESTWNRVWPLHELPFPRTFKMLYLYVKPVILEKKLLNITNCWLIKQMWKVDLDYLFVQFELLFSLNLDECCDFRWFSFFFLFYAANIVLSILIAVQTSFCY